MSYVKAHPFGYRPVEKKIRTNHKGEAPSRIQTIVVDKERVLDEEGNQVYVGKGKGKKPLFGPITPFVRTIFHYDHRFKGRTFADMVYESIRV